MITLEFKNMNLIISINVEPKGISVRKGETQGYTERELTVIQEIENSDNLNCIYEDLKGAIKKGNIREAQFYIALLIVYGEEKVAYPLNENEIINIKNYLLNMATEDAEEEEK